jgi:sRNA-binding carbon storage regulator CsrA
VVILETSDGPIEITLTDSHAHSAKLSIDAPESVNIARAEVFQPGHNRKSDRSRV